MASDPIDPEAVTDDLFEMGAGRSVADSAPPADAPRTWLDDPGPVRRAVRPTHAPTAPRVDASHPLVAKVLDLYRAAIRDSDTPEDLATRYVVAVARWMAANCPSNNEDGGTEDGLWFHTDLTELADAIEAAR